MEKVFTTKLKTISWSKIVLIMFLLGAILSCLKNYIYPPKSKLSLEIQEVTGKILEYTLLENDKIKMKVKLTKETILAYLKKDLISSDIKVGMQVKLYGKMENPPTNTIPNVFSYRAYLKTEHIFYQMQVTNLEVLKTPSIWNQLKEIIRSYCNKNINSTYLKKIILGIKEEENREVEESYRHNGISHIFAISGLHLTIIYQFFSRHKKEKRNILFAYSMVCLYYSIIVISSSSKRAFLFLTLNTINQLFHLRLSKSYLFFLTLCFMIIRNPLVLFQIGFQYSCIISFSFLIFSQNSSSKSYHFVKSSVTAFLFSIPITAHTNYMINPWSILNNIVLVPVMMKVLFPLLLLSFLCPILGIIPKQLLDIFEIINITFTKLPGSMITMPKIAPFWFLIYYLVLVLLIIFKKKRLFLVLILWLILWHFSPKWNALGLVHFIDVGQGDCTLIISPYQKEIILIDTGIASEKNLENLLTLLRSFGISKIHTLMITHGDKDHIGNALALLEQIEINKIVLNQGANTETEQVIKKKYGSIIKTNFNSNVISFHTLTIPKKESENDNSIINHLCLYQTCFLFLGDINQEGEEEIMKKYRLKVDVLKVAHHGSKTSTSPKLLEEHTIKYAIISAGKNNIYHHPHQEVLNRLTNQKITILKTLEEGTITFKIKPNSYTILTCPP